MKDIIEGIKVNVRSGSKEFWRLATVIVVALSLIALSAISPDSRAIKISTCDQAPH